MLDIYTTPTKQQALVDLQSAIFAESRNARPMRHLITAFLDRRNLQAALERVRQSEGANTPGIDGVTCAEVGKNPEWLGHLAEDLYTKRYRPNKPRIVEIPKPNKPGKTRRLGILTIRDRVVHTALKQLLEPILEPTFLPESFGFRPGRSTESALCDAIRRMNPTKDEEMPYTKAVHLDIANCFDTIDHRLLLDQLKRHIADPDVLRLLEELLKAGGTTVRNWFWTREVGVLQGSSLSPMLCNAALHPLDESMRQLRQLSSGGVEMLRYADDFLLLARDDGLMDRALGLVHKVLGQLQQELRTPTNKAGSILNGVDWLGVRLQPRRRNGWTKQTRFCYVVPDEKVLGMLTRITEMTTPPSERLDPGTFNLAKWIVSINTQLRDWREVYRFAENAGEVFEALDTQVREQVGELLLRVTGVKPSKLQETYRQKLPRGFSTWQVQGAQLVVLSSLAPECPGRLIHAPAWMQRKPKKATMAPSPSRPMLLGPAQSATQDDAPFDSDVVATVEPTESNQANASNEDSAD
jgi:group II intron reverse transcriptase/maturase